MAVPIESMGITFSNKIIVREGDHDIKRSKQRVQWIGKAIDYLTH